MSTHDRLTTALLFAIFLCAGFGAGLLFAGGHTGPGIAVLMLFGAVVVFYAAGAFEHD